MTGILILNVAFVAIVVVGIVGLLGWSVVSSLDRRETVRKRSRLTSRVYRMPEPTADVVERELTIYVPVTYLDDQVQADRVEDARGVHAGM
jgi:hypothetical protein